MRAVTSFPANGGEFKPIAVKAHSGELLSRCLIEQGLILGLSLSLPCDYGTLSLAGCVQGTSIGADAEVYCRRSNLFGVFV